ncbi:MAG: hypothetical protein PWQ19_977 [Tepidiphilus sp.]|mgnify:CR=1 FL=1|jgi:acid stress-induced BolA-like protein IbaG/YrbA|nr:hypothetical protein [Tepidiphilus sp.]
MSFLEPDMYDPKAIEAAIAAHLPCLHVQVEGKDGVHFTGLVVSEAFRGKRKVQQHQLVYQALGPAMGTEIHALALTTLTPEEWERLRSELESR